MSDEELEAVKAAVGVEVSLKLAKEHRAAISEAVAELRVCGLVRD